MLQNENQVIDFSKNELALLAMIFNLLEGWAENYLANRYEGRPAEEVITKFNEQALTLGIMLAGLVEENPDLIDQMGDVVQEAKELAEHSS